MGKYTLVFLLAALCAGPGTLLTAAPENKDNVPARPRPGAVAGPEDSLTIVALSAEEISKTWRVGSSGDLNLPLVGRIRVAGLTIEQIERELVERLKEFVIEPQVTVYISEFRSQPVNVTGAVERPGVTQMQGSRTLFDVLMLVGGPKNSGSTLTLTRSLEKGRIPYPGARIKSDGKYSSVTLDLKDVMEGKSAAANLMVEPADVIAVAEARQPAYVHIVGEVNKPGAVELVTQPTVSLMKVLAVAGGFTRTASPKHTLIRHIGAEGLQTEAAFVDVKKIMSGKAKDLELSAGDIVIVGTSQLMTYLNTASTSALSAGIYILARF